jgi:hypothetical protein
LKAISADDKLVLLNRLIEPYMMRVRSKETALVRIWGVFQVQCVGNYSTNLVLMDNISTSSASAAKFDLKGSIYAREVKEWTQAKVGKDLNFQDSIGALELGNSEAERLLKNIGKDVEMLASLDLMDYSLFVTVCESGPPLHLSAVYQYKSCGGQLTYIVALIDFLQVYNQQKRLEAAWKSKMQCVRWDHLSAVEPRYYARRFMKFVSRIVSKSSL